MLPRCTAPKPWRLCAVLLAGATLASAAELRAAPPAWPGDAQRYAIDARLDAGRHTVEGRVRIHLPNTTRAPLTTLELHLYANAFAHDATVFMREEGYRLRGGHLKRWGGCEVVGFSTAAGDDLLAGAEHELSPGDRTQLRVHLPGPLRPGAAIDVVIDFRTRLPNLVARMGFAGDFHLLGQWYPKLAKLRDDGTWDNFPYHGMGEFHADFADYEVRLDVPAGFSLAGSGRRIDSQHGAGRHRTHFTARRVHDVAYVAAPGLRRSNRRQHGVDVEVVHPPGYGPAMRRQLALLQDGLAHYGRAFGAYPWSTLTVLIPPPTALPASAMEYPTFIVTGGPWWALPANVPQPAHDLVTAHELAHQWFHSMIATHEVREPLLDEGLTQWASLDLLDRRYRRNATLRRALGRGLDLFDVVALTDRTFSGPARSSMLPAYRYDVEELARAIYVAPPLVLETVERTWGRTRLLAALGDYARRHRFGHPTLRDLFEAFDRHYWPGFARRLLHPALAGVRTDVRVAPGLERATRHGRLPLPMQVSVSDGGGRALRRWRASDSTFRVPQAASRIVVDPVRSNLLAPRGDLRAGIDARAQPRQWTSHLTFWLQQLWLLWMGP